MSWAMRRRILYLGTIVGILAFLIGTPIVYTIMTLPETCFDGKQNQTETAVDKGGPCRHLDARYLSAYGVLWARSFKVRDGSYNAIAYIQNPNEKAGVGKAQYRFRLYDDKNVIVAERIGETFVMPGGITPVFASAIPTGNRVAVRAFFELQKEMDWYVATDTTKYVLVTNKNLRDVTTMPRLTADVENTTVSPMRDLSFVAVVFDPQGNAFAASATVIPFLGAREKSSVMFTWPQSFPQQVGRIDVIARVPPVLLH